MKYFDRLFREIQEEVEEKLWRSLPFIEALAVVALSSRAIAEAIEVFPYSVNILLASAATWWAKHVAPLIDFVYGSLGYPFSPDVVLEYRYPMEEPRFPLPVWMMALFSFAIIYSLGYWLFFTYITLVASKLLRAKTSYARLLIVTGIAHIPMINWWFYNGCEMMYEIKRQEIYLSLLPPYSKSKTYSKLVTPWGVLPNIAPIEVYWLGLGLAVFLRYSPWYYFMG